MIACFVAPLRGSTNPTDLQQTVNPDYLLPTVLTRKFAIEYTGKVLEIPSGTKRLRIWIPAPPSTTVQRIEQLEFTPPLHHSSRGKIRKFHCLLPVNYLLNPYAEADGKPIKTAKSWTYRNLD